MTTEFQNMEQKKVWEILPKALIPENQKVIGAGWVHAKRQMEDFEQDVLQKDFVRFQEKT
jgi:hypothetical protein